MSKTMALRLKALAAAGGVVLLLTVVALTAGSLPGDDATRAFIEIDVAAAASVLRQVLFVLYLALLAHAAFLLMRRREGPGTRRSTKRASPLVTVLSVLILASVFFLIRDSFPLAPETTDTPDVGPVVTGQLAEPEEFGTTASPAGPDWELVALAVAGLAAVVYLVATRRRMAPATSPTSMAAPSQEVPAGPARPFRGTDPRGRVLMAYRTVEQAARHRGIDRGPGDTVGSHLRRLADLVADAADRLAALYNRARFSRHSISTADADAAEQAAGRIVERLS